MTILTEYCGLWIKVSRKFLQPPELSPPIHSPKSQNFSRKSKSNLVRELVTHLLNFITGRWVRVCPKLFFEIPLCVFGIVAFLLWPYHARIWHTTFHPHSHFPGDRRGCRGRCCTSQTGQSWLWNPWKMCIWCICWEKKLAWPCSEKRPHMFWLEGSFRLCKNHLHQTRTQGQRIIR